MPRVAMAHTSRLLECYYMRVMICIHIYIVSMKNGINVNYRTDTLLSVIKIRYATAAIHSSTDSHFKL